MCDELSFNPAWAMAPPIISTIFENLLNKDLDNCAEVCSLWNNISRIIKNRRKKISWAFYRPDDVDDHFEDALAKYVQNLNFELQFALILMSNTDLLWPVELGKGKFKSLRALDLCALPDCLPSSCHSLFTRSSGITGTTSDGKITDQLEGTQALTAIFFPYLSGVEVHVFEISGPNCKTAHEQMGIPEGISVKCLLIIDFGQEASNCNKIDAHSFLTKFLGEEKGQLAVGGTLIKEATYVERQTGYYRANNFGIALTGDNVYAASVIIPPEVNTAEGVEKKLKVLLETNIFRDQSIAFVFTSEARGEKHFRARNVESDVFRKLFPSIPLFGIFGHGELGINYIPNISKQSDWSHPFPSFSHKDTTSVFVIISVKL